MSDTVKLIEEIKASVVDSKKESATQMEVINASIKETGEKVANATTLAETSAKSVKELAETVHELQQSTQASLATPAKAKTLGEMVTKSDSFKAMASGSSNRLKIQANTIVGDTNDTLVQDDRQAGIIPGAFRSLRVADVLPSGTTTSNAVSYARELLFTNNAAETAEAGTKPESVITFEQVTAPVRTIAHYIKVSDQVLSDAPMLQAYIDTRMAYGVALRKENQLVAGDGTGANLSGITDAGNFTAFTPTAGDNQLDTLNRMIEAVALADYAADAIMLNTADWHAIERIKVGASDDRYVIGSPTGMMGPNLWGLPVVVSNAIPAGKAIVGAFNIAFMVFNRQETVVEVFTQNEDDVINNLLTVRAEGRCALASLRPASVVFGDLLPA